MKTSAFKTTFLNADDLKEPTTITIDNVIEEKVGNDQKLCIYTTDLEQPIPLNKTTILQLEQIFGSDETEDWHGQQVVVFNDKSVMFQGKRVGGIRFKAVQNGATAAKKSPVRKGGASADEFPGG